MAQEVAVKEHPILFTTENVRAILDGRKTQTRRVMRPQPSDIYHSPLCIGDNAWGFKKPNQGTIPFLINCPYGQVGDRLWVRETVSTFSHRHVMNHDAL